MKTVTNESDCVISIPIVHITAEDFVRLLEKSVGGNDSVELTIGERFDNTYTVLENLNEIKQHQSSISIPFSVETQGVTLSFRSYGVTLCFSNDARGPANTLASRLREFKPWYTLAFKPWFPGVSLIPLWLFLSSGITESLHISIFAIVVVLCALPAVFSISSSFRLEKPRLIQRERQGFWRRNRDAVAMLLLGAAGSLLVTGATHYLSSEDKTHTNSQTETTEQPSNE